MGDISLYLIIFVLSITTLGFWKNITPLIWGSALLFIYLGFQASDAFLMITLMAIGLFIFGFDTLKGVN